MWLAPLLLLRPLLMLLTLSPLLLLLQLAAGAVGRKRALVLHDCLQTQWGSERMRCEPW